MATHQVNLPDQLDDFVRRSVQQGQYADPSEVVRAGLRLLQQQDAQNAEKVKVLQKLATESFSSIDRGEFFDVSVEGLDVFLDGISSQAEGRRR